MNTIKCLLSVVVLCFWGVNASCQDPVVCSELDVINENGAILDLTGSALITEGWNNQIRFWENPQGGFGSLLHVIATNQESERLIIAPGNYGAGSDVLEVHGSMTLSTSSTPDNLSGNSLEDYKLYVNGGILAYEIRVATGWADYVFEPTYELMPLSEVRLFIDENNRLPDMPSEEEVEKKGIDVAEIAVKQQVKIEELFLYLLELEEEIEKLAQENERLATKVLELESE